MKRLALPLVVISVLASATPAAAQFRFLCNGINSDGTSDPDCNEPCNASTAPAGR